MAEFPSFQTIAKKYSSDDFALLTLNLKEKDDVVLNFIDEKGYDFTEWGRESGEIFEKYKTYNEDSKGIPQTVIIDRDGNVRYAMLGGIKDPKEFIKVIDELI